MNAAEQPYELRITPEGLRHLNHLPSKVRDAALTAVQGPLRRNPRRLGKPLVGQLAGLLSARRGDYRIVYSLDEEARTLIVHRIQHRSDVYRSR